VVTAKRQWQTRVLLQVVPLGTVLVSAAWCWTGLWQKRQPPRDWRSVECQLGSLWASFVAWLLALAHA
jgi:hypothetical protein